MYFLRETASLDGATCWSMATLFCTHIHQRHSPYPSLDPLCLSGTCRNRRQVLLISDGLWPQTACPY